MRTEVEELKRGVGGTKATLDKMHKLVAKGKLHPSMQKIATWIRLQVPDDHRGSSKELLDRLFWWVRKHGIFQRDPFQIEKIEHPIAAMEPIIKARRAGTYKGPGLFVGDCDTIAGVYLATLGGILGFHYAWETAKVDRDRPDEFSHVWVSFKTDGEWYPLDPSTKGASPGWRPPVSQDKFARWPEKEIMETLGMSGLSGNGRAGLGQEYVPEDYFGYGIPKYFPGKQEIPIATPSDLQPLIPINPAIPRGEIEPGLDLIKRVTVPGPATRERRPINSYPGGHGPPYYRKGHPYYKINRQPYAPGSPWNEKLPFDVAKYHKSGAYYSSQEPGTPERQVRIVMGDVMRVRRNGRHEIVLRPKRVPAGMGQLTAEKQLEYDKRVRQLQLMEGKSISEAKAIADKEFGVTEAAKKASTSVWDTIGSTIKNAIPTLSQAYADRTAAKYRERLNRATMAATGVNVPATERNFPTPDVTEKPWYAQPWLWIGGVVVIGGVAYIMTRKGPVRPVRVRRRRRYA